MKVKIKIILILSLLFTTTYSQTIFYHYVGLEYIENRFIVVEDGYKLYVIKFGKDTINMVFNRIDLEEETYMWYCENFPCLELVLVKDKDEIIQLNFYDSRKKEYYKYIKKSKKI